MKCLLLHKWGKWEQYTQKFIVGPGYLFAGKGIPDQETYETWQKRTCERCGKQQMEKVA